MKLHFPDGKGGVNTIEVSDNISLYIENLLEDWTLETASESVKGGIKVGDGLYMDGDSLSARQYTLLPATRDSLGGIMVGDGLSITADGILSAQTYTLPTANETLKGGIKIGDGFYKNGDSLNVKQYELPIASSDSLGGVIIGEGLTIDSGGVVSADICELPTASHSKKGGIKIGNGLTMTGESLNADAYELLTASETVKGGIMVGAGLYMDGDSLNASVSGGSDTYYVVEGGEGVVSLQPAYIENPYELPIANKTRLGGIKVGNGLEINSVSGVLSAKTEELPIATRGSLGVIIVGDGLEVDEDGVVDATLPPASRTKLGAIKVGEGLDMVGETLTVTITPENNYYYTLDGGEGLVTLQPVLIENPYTLPPATRENLGGVIIGNGLTIDSGGVVSAKTYTLPTASETVKGGIKIGDGLTMIGESLYADGYDLPTASNVTKGGIKVGAGLYMRGDSLNASSSSPATYTLPTATRYVKGGIKVGKGLYMSGDSLNAGFDSEFELPIATRDSLGGVIVGDGLEITEDGVLSCSLEAVSPADVETIVEEKITGTTSEWHGIATQIIDVTSDTEINNLIAQIDGATKMLLCYRLNNGDGACVLPEDFMDIAFSVRGDNNKFVSSSGALYDASTAGMDTIPNLSVTKTRQNGYCTIPISTAVFNMAFTQGQFIVEWGTESETGNVVFKGTVTALPNNPKHGWLCFVLYPTTRFYLYDGTAKQWRWWNVQGY